MSQNFFVKHFTKTIKQVKTREKIFLHCFDKVLKMNPTTKSY